jgi:hypothetical protein
MTENNNSSEYIRVLYNSCYGGFALSEEAVDEFNKLSDKPLIRKYISKHDINMRTNPIMLRIYDTLGTKRFSGNYSNILIENINYIYKDYISISEYDGFEIIKIKYHEYKVYNILSSTTLSDQEKVLKLKKIHYSDDVKKPISYFADYDDCDDSDE